MATQMTPMKGVTPAGVSVYSKWLYEKDTRFDDGDTSKAKFQGWLVFDKGDEASEAFVQERIKRHKQAKGKADHCPVKDGDERIKRAKEADVAAGLADEEGEEIADTQFHGKWLVKFTTKNAPTIFDAFKRKVDPEDVKIYPGDLIRFQYKENIPTKGFKGAFLYLDGVQLLEKNNNGFEGGDMFGVVDGGYQAPEAGEGGGDSKPAAHGGDF